ncbi:extracellular solute-binding protein [Parasphaerochaeta coccoides]|uniref:Sugar ABC transporter substrate-binding protein n=1 Tax=Parasphaerochaeta coccoides (strain ATCC BAA-1237 / DSM 17374 / SPN1) TaxID=760011 RepID=F4GLH0_PARC1|nr:extracellular solute-binding protein [Parasphaerochaeta coccoides]AEC01940.1 sugar ABC transporter substrate-binding protein [Parasphaerochaeta coccoides DSM 17374]
MKKRVAMILVVAMVAMFLPFAVFAAGSREAAPVAAAPATELDANGRFTTPRTITVEIYDRGNVGGSKPEDNFYTDFIKKGMKETYNVDVVFRPVPRWTEVDVLNNLLAAGDAPDVGVTYSYPTIQTYANMGGVVDLAPYLEKHKDLLPDLWALLGDKNIYYNKGPEDGRLWAIEATRKPNNRVLTFVREDWLKKLNLAEPTNLQEFEAMLRAFKANASLLLGADAGKLIPFSLSVDVGWRIDNIANSVIPNAITDKDAYIYGYDDRRMMFPNYKEAVRLVNKWYNEGLVWKDFALYPEGDKTEDNLMRAGYVGAFIHNWDYPYRDGENGIHGGMKNIVGPDAAYIAVDVFKNDAGLYRKYLPDTIDRKVFLPSTNDEVLASLLYLNWMSKLENRRFLQIGEAGVTHVVEPNGAIKTIAVAGDKIMNSPNNIDYTIVLNGLDLGDETLNARSIALGYGGVDARYIEKASAIQYTDTRVFEHYNVGEIKAEEGMATVLKEKRNNLLSQAVVAPTAQFDRIWDTGYADFLRSGGQAIIDERAAKFAKFYP